MSLSSWIAKRRWRARQKSQGNGAAPPVRVLYLFPEYYLNSPWAVIAMVLRHAAVNGIEPTVVLGEHTQGLLDFGGVEIPVLRMKFDGKANLSTMKALRALVLEREIDVIHIVDSWPSLRAGTMLSLLSRTPLVIHFHSIPRLWTPKKRAALKTAATVSGAIVGVSKFVRDGIEEYIGIRSSALTWVHNGVDVERFTPAVDGTTMRKTLGFKDGTIAVIEPARFWYLKGQPDLVRAVAIARKQNPAIELALIGWNDTSASAQGFRAEIEELAASLGVSDAVRCYDPNLRAQEIHAAADIVCLPSIDEPFGLVAVEAQACCRAFVGTVSGALPEMVTDGVDGLLVPPNSPEQLAAALLRLAADPELRAKLGANGRVRAAASFAETLLAPRFATIYRAVLDGSALPA